MFPNKCLPLAILIASAALLSACGNNSGNGAGNRQPAPDYMDRYSLISGATLKVPAPGVLTNDRAEPGTIVKLASRAKYGKVVLQEDGAFTYEPNWRFSGHDSFVYQSVTGDTISEPVTVYITRPNVVVIMVDDLGQGDVGIYNPRDDVNTPNIDALANDGLYFTHAHSTSAVCSPTRYSVLTGNYPWRGKTAVGVYNSYATETMIPRNQITLGDLFDRSGYQTAFFGKLHNGGAFHAKDGNGYSSEHKDIDFSRPFDKGPTQFGFDYSFLLPGGISTAPYAYFENDRLVRLNEVSGEFEPFENSTEADQHFRYVRNIWKAEYNGGFTGSPGYAMDNYDSREIGNTITGKVISYINQAAKDKSEPFFVYYALPQIHRPNSPPAEFTAGGEPQVVANQTADIRTDAIREVDMITGAVFDALEKSGELDNTLVIFTSDNGPFLWLPTEHMNMQGVENGVPLRGAKSSVYEGGHRVPLIVYWGDALSKQINIARGAPSSTLVGLHDLASTFTALLGQQRPQGQFNDSKSFLPVITGEADLNGQIRDHIFADGTPFSTQQRKIIDRAYYQFDEQGKLWKLIATSSTTDPLANLTFTELYKLSDDPAETNNLISLGSAGAWLAEMKSAYVKRVSQSRTIRSPE